MSTPHSLSLLPNVRARVRLVQRWPGLAERQNFLVIWTKDSRFRVRDEFGRDVASIIADATRPRDLGSVPATLEAMMDRSTAARARSTGTTELFGNLADNGGLVQRTAQGSWVLPAEQLAPVARQIFVGPTTLANAVREGTQDWNGWAATEYRKRVSGEERGALYESDVRLLVVPPYVLVRETRDANVPERSYRREIVALEEGVVMNDDLQPTEVSS